MYSGTTLTVFSGRMLGTHQKIDRIARKHLRRLAPAATFPPIRTILHFEGHGGPDAIKRKSPAQDEPWHYFSPFDVDDTQLIMLIQGHYSNLTKALKKQDEVVAAFEAAWLAHAVVDGLTPAHHYPYEEKLDELRGGLGKESRRTIKDKLIMPGDTSSSRLSNNWKMWGPKGLFTTHSAFEWGVATVMLPMPLGNALPSAAELSDVESTEVGEYFRRIGKEIAALGMYEEFYAHGWTTRLALQVRKQLAPTLVKTVTLIWYKAAHEASRTRSSAGSV